MESVPAPQPVPAQPPVPLTPSEERSWAMLAHLSILLNLVTGLLGVVGALVIYLVYQNRSRYVAYQALQSLIFQLVAWVGGGILTAITWTITGVFSAILIGLLCIPVAIFISLIPLAAVVYGVIGGIQCSQGQDFRYWLVGDWVRGTLTGS
ncbi:MAG TPA: DUF4870 domain-containing protein [Anaerolineae bacterium]|nr:DUF4870 domain-containing protein [Anaerolineae bacterium]